MQSAYGWGRNRDHEWRRWGSNPLPLACHASALPTELRPRGRVKIPAGSRRLSAGSLESPWPTKFRRSATPPRWPTRSSTGGRTAGTSSTSSTRRIARACSARTRATSPTARTSSSSTCSRIRAAWGCTSAIRSASSRTDVYARFQRMNGFNVLHTMGFDAFGLPAEQYAVQTGTHPRVTTEQNIATYRRQLRRARSRRTTRAAVRPPPTCSTTAGRSGSSCRSTTPGTTPTPGGRGEIATLVQELRAGRFPTPDGHPVRRPRRRSSSGDSSTRTASRTRRTRR